MKSAFIACIGVFLYVFEVARQVGKTYLLSTICIELGLKKKNARMRYGTAFQEDVEEFLRPVIEMIIEDCPEDLKPKWNANKSKYIFPSTGAELKIFGIDLHPNGVRGNALDLVVIDEGGFIKRLDQVIKIIVFMLKHRPELRVILSSSTSETPDHEFTQRADQAKIDGNYFSATIDDDETCDQAMKDKIAKECGGYDSTTYRREALCERIVDSDLAICPEWRDEYVQEIPVDEFDTYYHRYVGQDIGGTKVEADFTAHVYGKYLFKQAKLYIEDETGIRGPETTTDRIEDMVKAREIALWSNDGNWSSKRVYKRISDNNNPILLNDLNRGLGRDGKERGVSFIATNKEELQAMVNDLRILVSQGRLIVHPRCKMLIGCLKGGIYNSNRTNREFARSKVYGHYDWLAALIYLVRGLDQSTNPIPRNIGASTMTHHIRPSAHLPNETAHQLGKLMGKKFVTNQKRQIS